MRTWMIGMCALLGAGAARAEDGSEPYAKVGKWDITAEPAERRCTMARFFGGAAAGDFQGLIVVYDAEAEGVLLTVAGDKTTSLPAAGSVDLGLAFLFGPSFDESWGKQAFHSARPHKTHYLSHAFKGATDVRRILRDLAFNESIALFRDQKLITGLPLGAFEAVDKLRECSSKLAGRETRAASSK